MHDAPNEIQPSLLERLAQLSSDDVRKMMHSKGAGKMEKFGMFLLQDTRLQHAAAGRPDLVRRKMFDWNSDDMVIRKAHGGIKVDEGCFPNIPKLSNDLPP